MAATPLLLPLLSLLLVTAVTPSHYFAGRSNSRYEGRNPDGSWKVVFRDRATFDGCRHHTWSCYSGNCGINAAGNQISTLDSSRNAPVHNRQWCETETVSVRNVPSDRPFSLRAASCCWIQTRYNQMSWRLLTTVDLGQRSDTRKPNRSPDVAILPFLRVPQNCPRTYQLIPADPDDDHVRCRYGNMRYVECHGCHQYPGFQLDQDSCRLRYHHTTAGTSVYGFEMVVEDFPRETITLTYTDGSRSTRFPPHLRRRREAASMTSSPPSTLPPWQGTTMRHLPWWWVTRRPTTTLSPPTTAPWRNPHWLRTTRPWWWNPRHTSTTPRATTNYITRNTQPLSKAPLQFSFLVDPPVPTCQEGVYLPRLLSPTPQNGACIQAEVDEVLEITVKAQSSLSTIIDIVFSGPNGMTKHQRADGEFALRWRPTSADVGVKVPLCFAVESRDSSAYPQTTTHMYYYPYRPSPTARIYQSEMRCITIQVQEAIVRREVSCGQSSMTIAIEKASLPGLHEDHLRLTDPSNVACSFQIHSNHTHAVATFPLNACGTQIEENNENLIFKNEVTSVENQTALITRKHLLELDFFCEYPKHGNVTLGFKTHRKNVTVWEKGFGTFTYGFEFYNSTYGAMISPSLYPVEVNIGSQIYMQIEASSSVRNTELFVESCRASPYDSPSYTPTYPIIENGCAVDQTVMIHTSAHPNQFRFSVEAFKFIGLHDQVFISCSVLICERGNPNTRCARGCLQPGQYYRGKREVGIQTANHFISQGPIRLRRSAEGATIPDVKLNLNLVFIVGAVLAAVAVVSVTSYLKKRISSVKYQPLPMSDN
ncbi:uncharacterized protein ACB058_003226 [Synchiropus picturatus]